MSRFVELQAEMAAAALAMKLPALQHLAALGVPLEICGRLHGAGDIGLARVSVGKGGLWDPEGAEQRLILAVRLHGVLIDLLALSSSDRDSWALRTGVGSLLGQEALDEAFWAARFGIGGVTLALHATPFDWLMAGAAGVCVLDWDAAALGELRGLGREVTLVTDSEEAAARLHDLLRWGGLPRVVARGGCAQERRVA